MPRRHRPSPSRISRAGAGHRHDWICMTHAGLAAYFRFHFAESGRPRAKCRGRQAELVRPAAVEDLRDYSLTKIDTEMSFGLIDTPSSNTSGLAASGARAKGPSAARLLRCLAPAN